MASPARSARLLHDPMRLVPPRFVSSLASSKVDLNTTSGRRFPSPWGHPINHDVTGPSGPSSEITLGAPRRLAIIDTKLMEANAMT